MQRSLITHRQHYSNKKSPEQRSWKKARLYYAVLCNCKCSNVLFLALRSAEVFLRFSRSPGFSPGCFYAVSLSSQSQCLLQHVKSKPCRMCCRDAWRSCCGVLLNFQVFRWMQTAFFFFFFYYSSSFFLPERKTEKRLTGYFISMIASSNTYFHLQRTLQAFAELIFHMYWGKNYFISVL